MSEKDRLEKEFGEISHMRNEVKLVPKTTFFGSKYTEIEITDKKIPVFKSLDNQVEYNCRDSENKEECKSFQSFSVCMSRWRGTGNPQCTWF